VWSSEEVLSKHFQAVFRALDDEEFPVKVQAALALTEMIIVFDSGSYLSFLSHVCCSYNLRSSHYCRAPSWQSHSRCDDAQSCCSVSNAQYSCRFTQDVRRDRLGYPKQQHGDYG